MLDPAAPRNNEAIAVSLVTFASRGEAEPRAGWAMLRGHSPAVVR
jgi:hypothetical protein